MPVDHTASADRTPTGLGVIRNPLRRRQQNQHGLGRVVGAAESSGSVTPPISWVRMTETEGTANKLDRAYHDVVLPGMADSRLTAVGFYSTKPDFRVLNYLEGVVGNTDVGMNSF